MAGVRDMEAETPVRIRVSKSATAEVRRGHPWVYREQTRRIAPGTLVEIEAPDGTVVGWGLADDGAIAVRVLGRGPAPTDPVAEVRDRVARADGVRRRLLAADTDAYRVVAGAGDGLPGLVVDRYGELAVVRLYARAWETHLDALVTSIDRLGWARWIYRRLGVARVDGAQGGDLLAGTDLPDRLVVQENGVRLLVRPRIGQKTGLFLDQREHRALVGRWAGGRLVANLFAYTGGFSLYAALGGAARVTTVDIAPEAIADARENFRLNGLDPDDHAFEVADVFDWTPHGRLDLWVVDPPSLAHGKRSEGAARRAYQRLHASLGPHVPRDGLLATSSCTARLDLATWKAAVADGLRDTGDWSWHWVSADAPDHPVGLTHREGAYLKFALLRRR